MEEISKLPISQLFKLRKKPKQTVAKNFIQIKILMRLGCRFIQQALCRDVTGKHLYILSNMNVKLFTHLLPKRDIHLLS
jgi:hypothetical protein